MKEINYLEILKKAFLITWKNKQMWFFGFLVFIGSFATTFNNSSIPSGQKNQLLQIFQSLNQNHPLTAASLAFVLVLLIIALYILKIVATASLIKMANNTKVYKQSTIKSIFFESKKYVWQIFAMETLVVLIVFAFTTIILMPFAYLYFLNSKLLASFFLVFGFFIIAILFLLAFYLIKYGQIYLVLGDLSLRNSLELAYGLLEKNIKSSLIFGIISLGINFAFLILLTISILILSLLLILIGFIFYLIFFKSGIIVTIIISFFSLLILILGFFSWFNSFMQSAWVIFFQQLSLEKKEEKKKSEVKIEANAIIPDPEAV